MNGFLYIDKPMNMTSRDVVNIISRTFQIKRVGHTGTLDPLATGVLVVAVGEGCKLIETLSSSEKTYLATCKLGLETDTLDMTGNVLERQENYSVQKEEVERVLSSFVGSYEQEVPLYSAVRVGGKRLYEYARSGEKVELPKRMVTIKEISLTSFQEDSFTFLVSVSKGTYIRSLIRDIGSKLGTFCTMSALRRVKQGNVSISSCIPLDQVNKNTPLVTISEALSIYPEYRVDEKTVFQVKNGVRIKNPGFDGKVRICDKNGNFIALYQTDEIKDILKMDRIFLN